MNKINNQDIILGSQDLPPALRVYYDIAPESFRIPSILAAITCLCALGTRLRVKYVYDTELHALLLQVVVVGNPGDGKSFTRPIVKTLLAPSALARPGVASAGAGLQRAQEDLCK